MSVYFLTSTCFISVHLQSWGGKDDGGDQVIGFAFHMKIILEFIFFSIYIIQISLMWWHKPTHVQLYNYIQYNMYSTIITRTFR